MSHRCIISNFFQQNFEPLYITWDRFNDYLCRFPFQGFSLEDQIEIFIKGLNRETWSWVARGDVTKSFFQQSIHEAFYMMNDMAEFDRQRIRLNVANNNYYKSHSFSMGSYGLRASEEQKQSVEDIIASVKMLMNSENFQLN